ncbi:MAG: GDSL-type esterase/lipase family protein [Bacteroidales bacterium]
MKFKWLCFPVVFILLLSCNSSVTKQIDSVSVQQLENFELDGNFDEWEPVPFRKLFSDPIGNFPSEEDLDASFKIAWKNDKLLLYFEIRDNQLVADTVFPWKGDAIELFLMDHKGSDNSVQYSIVTGEEKVKKAKTKIQIRRKTLPESDLEPVLSNYYTYNDGIIKLELELKYDIFIENQQVESVAFQVYVDDSDSAGSSQRNQLTWYPIGHTYVNSFAAYQVLLSDTRNTIHYGASRAVITDNEKLELIVFGAEEGESISVQDQAGNSYKFTSNAKSEESPDTLRFKSNIPDLENDTLFVFIEGNYTGMHDLFLAPRVYIEKEPKRFEREIKVFVAKDRMKMPEPGGVVFIGSSSIRMWSSVQKDFPELNVIHRGFGGSISTDALNYMDKIVLPYQPGAVVYYEGDNDIPHGLTNDEIIANMRSFTKNLIDVNPSVKIYLLSPKPAIVRMNLWDKYLTLHERMKEFASGYEQVEFVNVASQMFENGELRNDIFIEDNLHMNEKGYEIWTKILRNAMGLD